MVENQVHARPWHQHGQAPQELHGIEDYVRRPVRPRVPEREAHLAVGREGEPLGRDRRSEHVAADPFEAIALLGYAVVSLVSSTDSQNSLSDPSAGR
jgi:hypothetical protein